MCMYVCTLKIHEAPIQHTCYEYHWNMYHLLQANVLCAVYWENERMYTIKYTTVSEDRIALSKSEYHHV